MKRHLLLGTAGHVDHGKTALVKSLTGTDTDRLPEEKRRGITLELGFARLANDSCELGIVDVPGHEDLIRNMLAGATGIDLGLLVIAADEGVMPQTCEHFQVLKLLGLSHGVIALTKIDLVDNAWLALVEEEIATLVAGSFLQPAQIIRTSATTGDGIETLRDALFKAAADVTPRESTGPFRMAIDRSFTMKGHGTVVTGSVSSGTVAVGDSLELMPKNVTVKVRALQSHSQEADSLGRGQRAALNLTGIHYRDIQRGQIVATPGSLQPSRLVTVALEILSPSQLRNNKPFGVRAYFGTAELVGKLHILAQANDSQPQTVFAQVQLEEDLCAVWRQPFIVRDLTENRLLGGGVVIDPLAYRIKRSDALRIALVSQLANDDEELRLLAMVRLAGTRDWQKNSLLLRIGISESDALIERLLSEQKLVALVCGNRRRLIDSEHTRTTQQRIVAQLLQEHQAAPLKRFVPLDRLRPAFTTLQPKSLLDSVVAHLAEQGKVVLSTDGVALANWRGNLSARQADISHTMIDACQRSGFTPPNVSEFADQFQLPEEEIEALLQLAADFGTLIRLPSKESTNRISARSTRLFLHSSQQAALFAQIKTLGENVTEWTVSEFCSSLFVSRKYGLPLCKYLDEQGITHKKGDRRSLASPTLCSR